MTFRLFKALHYSHAYKAGCKATLLPLSATFLYIPCGCFVIIFCYILYCSSGVGHCQSAVGSARTHVAPSDRLSIKPQQYHKFVFKNNVKNLCQFIVALWNGQSHSFKYKIWIIIDSCFSQRLFYRINFPSNKLRWKQCFIAHIPILLFKTCIEILKLQNSNLGRRWWYSCTQLNCISWRYQIPCVMDTNYVRYSI